MFGLVRKSRLQEMTEEKNRWKSVAQETIQKSYKLEEETKSLKKNLSAEKSKVLRLEAELAKLKASTPVCCETEKEPSTTKNASPAKKQTRRTQRKK